MMITEEMYEIPIFMDNDLASYEHHSFARGYHAYMEIWSPLIGETLSCKREPSNVVDKDAIAIMATRLLREGSNCWTHVRKCI